MTRRQFLGHIYGKTNGHCWYCGEYLEPFSDWQIDHQLPKTRGGGNEIYNLVPSCRKCNRQKFTRTVSEYHASLTHAETGIKAPPFYGRRYMAELMEQIKAGVQL